MARNKVQFQRGLSDVEFERLYGTEEKCREALFSWRWPEGFVCPAYGSSAHCELKKRALWQCNACHTQTSLTAGTIFASTKLDLTVWFRAMFHMTQTKQGISALELSRSRQHQELNRCHLPIGEQEARGAPARRVRVPIQ